MEQFNAQQANAMEARRVANALDIEKANMAMINEINKFNDSLDFERDKFNTANAQAIEQSNVEWRRKANMADTAMINQINMQNAQNAYDMNTAALSFFWQEMRDEADRTFRASENEIDRKTQLLAQSIANAESTAKNYTDYNELINIFGNLFNPPTQSGGTD